MTQSVKLETRPSVAMTIGKVGLVFIFSFCLCLTAGAQFLLQEDFSGTSGSSVSSLGWTEQCGAGQSGILLSNDALSKIGLAGFGVGKAAEFSSDVDGTAERLFSNQSFPLYVSFLIQVQTANLSTGGLPCGQGIRNILNFVNNGGGTTNEENGLVIRSSGAGFEFGLDGNSLVYSPTVYNYGETYHVVLKARSSGVDLFINPGLGNSEPVADIQTAWGGSPPTNANGLNISESGFGEFLIDAIRVSPGWSNVTALQEPTAQPTNLTFYNISPTEIDGTFEDPVSSYGKPDYLVLRQSGSAPTDVPTDGTAYAVGNMIGTSTVVLAGPGSSFQDPGLTPGTAYYYSVYSFYADGSYNYYLTSPLQGNITTPFDEPSVQVSDIISSSVGSDVVEFSLTPGNGSHHLIVMKAGGPVDAAPIDYTPYTGSTVFGSGSEIGTGNFVVAVGEPDMTQWTVTSLQPATAYFIQGFSFNDNTATSATTSLANFLTSTASGNPMSFTTLALKPTTQASAISFLAEAGSLTLNFTDGNGSNRLILGHEGGPVDADPADGVTYTVANVFGNGSEIGTGNFVVGSGSGPVTVTGLTEGTVYHFRVYEFNGSGGSENYLTSPATGNPSSRGTLFSQPTVQTTALTVTSRTTNGVQFNVTAGNGTRQMIVFKQGSPVDALPEDGTVYNGTYVFGTGSEIGDGNFVIGVGQPEWGWSTGLLEPDTQYFIRSFALNDNSPDNNTTEHCNFLTDPSTGNPISFFTFALEPTDQPDALTFSAITGNSLTANFTAAADAPDGYLALMSANQAPDFIPVDGEEYDLNQVVGNVGGNNIYAVFSGNGTSFDLAGLSPGETLHFSIYSLNGSGESINYFTTAPLAGSQITLAASPSIQAADVIFSGVGVNELTLNFTNGDGDSRIVVAREISAAAQQPIDGVTYSTDTGFGLGDEIATGNFVVAIGSGPHTITGLIPGTSYAFDVYEFNGSGNTINYLTDAPATGSEDTTFPEPVTQASGVSVENFDETSITLAFALGDGQNRYLVAKQGSPVDADPEDRVTYTVDSNFGQGSELGSGNFVVGTGGSPMLVQGLSEGPYYFRLYEFNGFGGTENYLTTTATGNPIQVKKVWHVSTSGNDVNDGSSGAPLRNIQTVLSAANPGDIIKVAGGIYEEGLIPQSKVALFGGYSNTFAEADRDLVANRTTVKAVSATILNDDYGCTIDGFFFDGNNVAETGLDISSSSSVTHNIIVRCTQGVDYGMNVSGDAVIKNNVIHGNIRGVLLFGGTSAGAVFKNNIVTGNSNVGLNNSSASGIHTYNCVQGNGFNYTGNSPGIGDISLNPLYESGAGDDFRLQPGSPAIDRGDPADPVGDEPIYNGGRIDMGAYGGTRNATPTNPIIESFAPLEGPIGTVVTITGLNFSSTPANNMIKFNGVIAPVNASTSTSLTTAVPSGATAGPITVEVNGGIGTSASGFIVIHPPTLASFTPAQGAISTSVTILGSGFSTTPANNIVFFGAARAQITSASENSLTVLVPPAAAHEVISVLVGGLTGYSKTKFMPISAHAGPIDETFFESRVTMTAGGDAPFAPAFIDFDADGKPDIATASPNGKSISVLKNKSSVGILTSTSFGSPVTLPIDADPRTLKAGDLNSDGKPDIIVGDFEGNNMSIFENVSTSGVIDLESFSELEITTDPRVDHIAIGDLDVDGKPDVIYSAGGPNYRIVILKNTNSGGNISSENFPPAFELSDLSTADIEVYDLNLDGKPELIINASGEIYIFENVSTPGVLNINSFLAPIHFSSAGGDEMTIGDVNGDNLPDLILDNVNSHAILVFENNITMPTISASAFSNVHSYSAGENPQHPVVTDFNGDGKLDIVVLNYNDPTISVYENIGVPTTTVGPTTFAGQITFTIAQNSYGLTVGDADLDGAPDILVSGGSFVDILRSSLSASSPSPVIDDFNPKLGPVETVVTIDGQNFGASPIVKFNNVTAPILSSTEIQIITEVPTNATDGFITVESEGKVAVSSEAFDVTPSAPVIGQFYSNRRPRGHPGYDYGSAFTRHHGHRQV